MSRAADGEWHWPPAYMPSGRQSTRPFRAEFRLEHGVVHGEFQTVPELLDFVAKFDPQAIHSQGLRELRS